MTNHLVVPPDGARWLWPLSVLVKTGWLGVDLFFVLSGFLITGILLGRQNARSYFAPFYWHRALRIWPVYFSVLFLITAVLPVLDHRYASFAISAQGIWPYWLFLSNLRLLMGPFLNIIWIPALAPAWSLAIEEQFYIGWSVMARFFHVRILAAIAILLLFLGILLRCWLLTDPLWSQPAYISSVFFFTFTHLDGLCVGVLLSIGYWGRVPRKFLVRFAKCWWAFLFLTIGVLAADHILAPQFYSSYGPVMLRIGLTVVALLFGSIVMHGILLAGWVRRVFDLPVLMLLGTYSYCMYLVHMPLMYAEQWAAPHLLRFVPALRLQQLGDIPQPFLFLFQASVVIVVAACSYRWLERPMLNLKSHVPYR